MVSVVSSDAVDELVQQVRSRIHDDIQRLHGTMPLWGVDRWVSLGELFVDVNILEQVSSSRKSELDDLWQDFTAGNSTYRSLDRIGLGKEQQRVSGLAVLDRNTNLMVLGKPGSGKTTYLQRIVTECNAGKLQSHRIPMLIKLREFIDDGESFQYSLESYLANAWEVSEVDAKKIFKQGRLLILLDGLDEVTGGKGKQIAKEIQQFARAYPSNLLIVTCRTQSQESRFERFNYVEVADFNEPQVRAFAEHWFRAIAGNESVGSKNAQAFLEQLFQEENKAIRELAITPILLSLTCAVFQQTGKFYAKRSKLYEEGLELLLEQWDKSREIERDEIYRDLSVERKLELLSHLAVKKFEQGQYILFEQAELEEHIAEFLEIRRREARFVLRAIESQHGLLIERYNKIWSFSHLTLQEYLVAFQFHNQAIWDSLITNIVKVYWREVFLMASEISPKTESLLDLISLRINEIVIEDENIQQLLYWINEKSKLTDLSYEKVAVRAFYIEIMFALLIAPEKAKNGTIASLNPRGRLILFLEGAFSLNLTHACKNGIQKGGSGDPSLSLDYALVYALVLALALSSEYIYDVNLCFKLHGGLCSSLEQAFKSAEDINLKQIILELKADLICQVNIQFIQQENPSDVLYEERHQSKWNMKLQIWIEQIRAVMIRYRNLGHNWQFSSMQLQYIRQYYYASITLIRCINSNYELSHLFAEKIENTLLLPISEIKKRSQTHEHQS